MENYLAVSQLGLPFPYPGGSSHPGVEPMSPALTVLSLNHTGPPGKSDEPLGLWRKLRGKYQGLTPLPNLTELYPRPPASAGRFFTLEPPGKPCVSKKVHGEEQLRWSLNHLKRFPLDSKWVPDVDQKEGTSLHGLADRLRSGQIWEFSFYEVLICVQ